METEKEKEKNVEVRTCSNSTRLMRMFIHYSEPSLGLNLKYLIVPFGN
jgi:hypothetical protein